MDTEEYTTKIQMTFPNDGAAAQQGRSWHQQRIKFYTSGIKFKVDNVRGPGPWDASLTTIELSFRSPKDYLLFQLRFSDVNYKLVE